MWRVMTNSDAILMQDCRTIQLAVAIGLEEVRREREVRAVRPITDTGGENWGTLVRNRAQRTAHCDSVNQPQESNIFWCCPSP
jgi:hypothetical protein